MTGSEGDTAVEQPKAAPTMTASNTATASCPMKTWPRPILHIDRKDLYTNLEDRVHFLHTFLDFSSSTLANSKHMLLLFLFICQH